MKQVLRTGRWYYSHLLLLVMFDSFFRYNEKIIVDVEYLPNTPLQTTTLAYMYVACFLYLPKQIVLV